MKLFILDSDGETRIDVTDCPVLFCRTKKDEQYILADDRLEGFRIDTRFHPCGEWITNVIDDLNMIVETIPHADKPIAVEGHKKILERYKKRY